MLTIISGGQTGVDRAALDAALELGSPCGGCCPEGREAEDGVIPERYPLKELQGSRYSQRTKRNIIDCDATLIIFKNTPTGGTALTIKFCIKLKKPHLLIDTAITCAGSAKDQLQAFIKEHSVSTLNVAGPSMSTEQATYAYTKQLIRSVLDL